MFELNTVLWCETHLEFVSRSSSKRLNFGILAFASLGFYQKPECYPIIFPTENDIKYRIRKRYTAHRVPSMLETQSHENIVSNRDYYNECNRNYFAMFPVANDKPIHYVYCLLCRIYPVLVVDKTKNHFLFIPNFYDLCSIFFFSSFFLYFYIDSVVVVTHFDGFSFSYSRCESKALSSTAFRQTH